MRNIRKLICLLLSMILLAGCSIVSGDVREKLTRDRTVVGGYVETFRPKQGSLTEREENILSSMTLTLENDYLQLYLGEYYDIAVVDKRAGKAYLSGDVLYDGDGNRYLNGMYHYGASQLSVEYYDHNGLTKTKTTYPDCYLDDTIRQIFLDQGEDYVRITYCMGQRNDQYVIPYVLTGETYTRLKKEAEALSKEGTLSRSATGQFIRAYKKITVSALSESERAEVSEKYANIAELGTIYVVAPNLTNKVKGLVSSVCVTLGVDEAMIQEQMALVGATEFDTESVYSSESDYFEIPVVYRLDNADFIATVETGKIETSQGAYLSRIYLLNSFASQKNHEEGYLFLPDGSGTIIENDTSVYGISLIDIPFYGHDFGVSYENFDDLPPYSSMPVFGIKGADAAVFAIVESGDAIGGAMGRAGLTSYPYASAYPYLAYYVRDYLNRNANVYHYSNVLPTEDFTVRYHFLYGEDANYSGMARYYRDYLSGQGVLKRLAQSDDVRLNLRLLGAINKLVTDFGIPVKQVVPVTSFTQAKEIIGTLHNAGVRKLDILYTEIMNGAREYKAPSRVDIEDRMGGEDEYDELVRYADSLGYAVYPGVDLGKIVRKGNMIRRSEDLILRISRDEAGIYNDYFIPTGTVLPYFVNPARYPALAEAFLSAYEGREGNHIYLQTLGYFLSANYNEHSGLTRTESQILTVDALKTLSDASLTLKMDGGAMHALPYADSLVNVELDSSRPRLEKHAVPFVAMVLKGYIPFAGPPINNSGDYERAFLKMLENGAELYYEIMAEESFVLTDTEYTDMYSVGADLWLNEMIEKYTRLSKELKGLANERIYAHRQLAEDVFETTYENGVRVIVNYSDAGYRGGGVSVAPLNFAIIRP